jgi:hypothetical protein
MRLLLSLLAVFMAFALHAQKQPGYVLLDNGDTLTGSIRLKQKEPLIVTFWNNDATEYSVKNCKAVSLNGKDNYERWTVRMDMSHMSKEDYVIHCEDSVRTSTVLLKQLYKGKTISLFHCYELKDHFFLYNGKEMQELIVKYVGPDPKINPIAAATINGQWSVREERAIYKDQLRMYLDDEKDRKLKYRLDEAEYRRRDLLPIIVAIDKKL